MLYLTFLHYLFSKNLSEQLFSYSMIILNVIEVSLVTKITHFFIFYRLFFVESRSIKLYMCSVLKLIVIFYFVHIIRFDVNLRHPRKSY